MCSSDLMAEGGMEGVDVLITGVMKRRGSANIRDWTHGDFVDAFWRRCELLRHHKNTKTVSA